MTFRKRIANNEKLIAGLRARGYELRAGEDENHCRFSSTANTDISADILISIFDKASFDASLFICSKYVGEQFRWLGLDLGETSQGGSEGECVTTVSLLWLRLNLEPDEISRYRQDYSYVNDAGIRRFFEDLDSVGTDFMDGVGDPRSLADLLVNLPDFPSRIKLGGRPNSVDRFVYAAILYMQVGDYNETRKTIDNGMLEYSPNGDFVAAWQRIRYEDFSKRARLILESLEQHS